MTIHKGAKTLQVKCFSGGNCGFMCCLQSSSIDPRTPCEHQSCDTRLEVRHVGAHSVQVCAAAGLVITLKFARLIDLCSDGLSSSLTSNRSVPEQGFTIMPALPLIFLPSSDCKSMICTKLPCPSLPKSWAIRGTGEGVRSGALIVRRLAFGDLGNACAALYAARSSAPTKGKFTVTQA